VRNTLIIALLIVFFGLLQSTVFVDILRIDEVKPDLLLIVIAFVAFKRGGMAGQLTGFAAGMLQHFFSPVLFGSYAFVFTVVGFVLGLTQHKVNAENFITSAVLVFIATIIKGLALGILALLFVEIGDFYPSNVSGGLLLELVINPILAGPLFWMMNRFAAPAMR